MSELTKNTQGFSDNRLIKEDLGYSQMLMDMGVTEDQLQELTHKEDDRIDIELDCVEVCDSSIEGKGILAVSDIAEGDVVGIANIDCKRTQIGRYTNHSDTPSTKAKIIVDKLVFVAIENISSKAEVTVDYRQVRETTLRLEARLKINGLFSQIAETDGHRAGTEEELVRHHFSDGVYVREYFMKKHDVVVGKIHRHNHIAMLLKGRARVFSEEGDIEMSAYRIWNSKAGERRAVFALEDCVFATVHPTEETDLDKIEEYVIAPDYEALEGSL